jgi:hypothetical protein
MVVSGREKEVYGTWNYRLVQSLDGTEYFIAEVYYDGDRLSWADATRASLRWDSYDELKRTIDLIRQAFEKPTLRFAEDDRLIEGWSG